MQCKATSKRSGKQCKKDAVVGREVCHIHGGKSLSGIAHPNFRHGRRSKYLRQLPERLRKAVEDIRTGNPNYLTLREELELVDAQILGALDAMYGAEDWTVLWKGARQALKKFYAASRAKQKDLAAAALEELQDHIEGGSRLEVAMWRLQRFIDLRRKLASTEGRNLERAAKVLTAGEMLALVQQFQLATKELVGGILGSVAQAHGLDVKELEKLSQPALQTWVEEIRSRSTPATDPLPPSPADTHQDPTVH